MQALGRACIVVFVHGLHAKNYPLLIMKSLRAFTCFATLLCFASNAHASAEFYARPSLYHTEVSVATGVYTSGKLGLGIAAGCTLGTRQSFALELEVTSTTGMNAHDVDRSYIGSIITTDTTVDMAQYLINFRYFFQPMHSPVRFFIGPTAGYWTERGNGSEVTKDSYSSFVYPTKTHSISETGFLLGPTLGAAIKVNDHAKIELAYRLLLMLTSNGSNGHSARQFSVSFNYRF